MATSPSDLTGRDLRTLFGPGAVAGLPDAKLLERFADDRDEAAFEAIVRRHGPMVWGVCRRILRDHHEAEEAFQATFLVLARKARALARRDLLAGWLHAVATRSALRARAMAAKRRAREQPAPELPEPEPDAVRDDGRDDLLDRLDRELAVLPAIYRLPIVLCELEGKTQREAAEQLGWPLGTLSGRLSRARALLARRLSRRGPAGAIAPWLARDAGATGPPAALIGPTARAACRLAAGGPTAGLVSARVLELTAGVLKMMMLARWKITTAVLLATLGLAAGGLGLGLAHRAQAGDPPPIAAQPTTTTTEPAPGPGPSVPTPAPEPSQGPPAAAMTSYPFTLDPEGVYEFPDLTVEAKGFQLKAGKVAALPVATEKGITGALLIGDGTFRYAPEPGKPIEGQFHAALLRFSPDEQATLLPLGKGRKTTDRGIAEMGRHLLAVIIRHCYQANYDGGRRQEVLLPPKGAFAAVLYSKEHGDLLISFDEKTATVHDFTARKTLAEKR